MVYTSTKPAAPKEEGTKTYENTNNRAGHTLHQLLEQKRDSLGSVQWLDPTRERTTKYLHD